jgi:hypothetical protein
LANKAASAITQVMTNATITAKGDTKNNYAKTVVVAVSGNQSSAAAQIAKLLGATVQASIPTGETKPNADIFVILGTDFSK